ncbi:MAG: hypothetical protein ACI4UE_01885 [Candidatus Scatovivens sp.]
MNRKEKNDNLNIVEFYGSKENVINNYIKYLESMLTKKQLDISQQKLIFAYINKLLEYQKLSDTSTLEFKEFIDYINEEYIYLQNKYPHIPIEFQGRIKSLISTDSKIKKDLKSSLLSGEPFEDISIKDILAYRYILNIPENLCLDPNEAVKICYDVLTSQIQFNLSKNNILSEAKHVSYPDSELIKQKAKDNNIFIPSKDFSNEYSKYIKDYIKSPKDSLYQALHIRYIMQSGIYFESQIKTRQMHEYAEFGGASHKYYKPRSTFNIHKVPQELGFIKKESGYKIDLLTMDESIKLYYGYDFKDRFGVSFKDFSEKYTEEEKVNILKGNLIVLDNGLLIPEEASNFKNIKLKKSDVSLSELLNLSKDGPSFL